MSEHTACKNCIYIIANDSVENGIWYNYTCNASPLPSRFNPILGEYESNPRYDFCRNVNKGNCELFEQEG
jgi:hypothetical protein